MSGIIEPTSGIFGTFLCQWEKITDCRKGVFAQGLGAIVRRSRGTDFVKWKGFCGALIASLHDSWMNFST